MNFPVNSRKATNAVSRLIQESGADVDYLRVIKLVYLADRESILERGTPIVGGHYYSMPKGPVIGEVMTFTKCRNAPGWDGVIDHLRGHALNLIAEPSFDFLASTELDLLDSVVKKHFNRSTLDLVHWCHKHCKEYESVWFGRKPIAVESILRAEGKPDTQIKRIQELAAELSEMDALLA